MTTLEEQYYDWISRSPEFNENLSCLADLSAHFGAFEDTYLDDSNTSSFISNYSKSAPSSEVLNESVQQLICEAALVRILYQMYQAGDDTRLDDFSDPLANLIGTFETEATVSYVVKILLGSDSFSELSAYTWKEAKSAPFDTPDLEQCIDFFSILIDALCQYYPSEENLKMAIEIGHNLIIDISHSEPSAKNIPVQEEIYLLEICYLVIKSLVLSHPETLEIECRYFSSLTKKHAKKLRDNPVLNYKNALSYQAAFYIKTGCYKQAEQNLLQAIKLKGHYPNPYIDYTIYQNLSYLYTLIPSSDNREQQLLYINLLKKQILNRKYPVDIDPLILAQTILNCSAYYMAIEDYKEAYETLIRPELNYILNLKYGWRAALKLYPAVIIHRISSGEPLQWEERLKFKKQLEQIKPYFAQPDIQLNDLLHYRHAEAMLAYTEKNIPIMDNLCKELSALNDEERRENLASIIGIYDILGACYYQLNETEKAISLLKEAIDYSRQYVQRAFCFHQITELSGFLKLIYPAFYMLYSIFRETSSDKECYDLLINHKHIEENIIRQCLDQPKDSEYGSLQKQIFSLQDKLAELSLEEVDNYKQQEILLKLQELEAQYSMSDKIKPPSLSRFTLEEIAQAMPDSSVLIEYFAIPKNILTAATDWRSIPNEKNSAKFMNLDVYCIVKENGTLQFFCRQKIRLDYDSIATTSLKIRESFSQEKEHTTAKKQNNLSRILIQPYEQYLTRAKHVFLAPEGELYNLPFGILPLSDGRLLGEACCITYVSTGRCFLSHGTKLEKSRHRPFWESLQQPSFNRQEIGDRYFIAGAPNYAMEAKTGTKSKLTEKNSLFDKIRSFFDTESLEPLPFSGIETKIIAEKLNVKPWCNSEASKEILKNHCYAELIHISTHGLSAYTNDNWLTHGIAMAGTNKRPQKEESIWNIDNGILTADEITRLDLSHTDLFVLSACSSGLEEDGENQENAGLRTALQIAGVKYVISSLWDIEDFSSTMFMIHFYANMIDKHMTPPAALQASQQFMRKASLRDWKSFFQSQKLKQEYSAQLLELLEDIGKTRPIPFQQPHYWAAFICQQNRF